MHQRLLNLVVAAVLLNASGSTLAAPATSATASTTIDLTAEAGRSAPNDLARATLFAEAVGAAPSDAARKVNTAIGEALAVAKGNPRVKVQTGSTSTYPVYAKGGKIESWRIRSEMSLESTDTAALSELVGKLQGSLGVAGISLMPSPETRRKAENEATLDAIAAFRARAKLVADALGKPYRIKHLSVSAQGYRPPMPMMRAAPAAMAAEMAPIPVEAGESTVSVSISGQIEITD